MPINKKGRVTFTTTLFALIRLHHFSRTPNIFVQSVTNDLQGQLEDQRERERWDGPGRPWVESHHHEGAALHQQLSWSIDNTITSSLTKNRQTKKNKAKPRVESHHHEGAEQTHPHDPHTYLTKKHCWQFREQNFRTNWSTLFYNFFSIRCGRSPELERSSC